MAADVSIKQNDTHPPLEAILKDATGAVINLTTATQVKLLAKTATGAVSWSGVCTIVSAAAGSVKYDWAAAPDTATVNTYNAEFQITWSNGKITTVPTIGYFTIEVIADLGS